MSDIPLTHTTTRATLVRVGTQTAHVVLPLWYGGQILAPVETWAVMMDTGLTRAQLLGAALCVSARLDARTERGLELRNWALQPRAGADTHGGCRDPRPVSYDTPASTVS